MLLGKFIGIFLFTWLAVKSGLSSMPPGMNWRSVAGVYLLGGIGFTVSLFIANLSFAGEYPDLLNQAKFGVDVYKRQGYSSAGFHLDFAGRDIGRCHRFADAV